MNILIVEDEEGITRFLKKGLSELGFTPHPTAHGQEALELLNSPDAPIIDIAVVDYMMPVMNGKEFIKALRAQNFQFPVIMLTAKDRVEDKVELLNLGCDDYLTKPFSFSELVSRINSILRRTLKAGHGEIIQEQKSVLKFKDISIDLNAFKVSKANKELALTKTEIELLIYLLKNRDRVVSRTQILQNVRGYSFDPNTNIVDVHIKSLRKKMGDFELIKTVRGMGYMIESEGKL